MDTVDAHLGIAELRAVLEAVFLENTGVPPEEYSSGEHSVSGYVMARAIGTAVIHASGNCFIIADENAKVYISGRARCSAYGEAYVQGIENSKSVLNDECTGSVCQNAEMVCLGKSRVHVSGGGCASLSGNSHATVSGGYVTASEDATISLVAESTIRAIGRVVITQGPFVNSSDVRCGEDAVLIGAWRPGDRKPNNGFGLPLLKKSPLQQG